MTEEDERDSFKLFLVAAGLASFLVLTLYLIKPVFHILLILFTGILFALFLDAVASSLAEKTPLSRNWALTVVILVFFTLLLLLGWVAGNRIVEESLTLMKRIPQAGEVINDFLREQEWGNYLLNNLPQGEKLWSLGRGMFGSVRGIFSSAIGVFVYLFFILFTGIYLAASPQLYLQGLLKLSPPKKRPQIRETLFAVGNALRWWLVGQIISMVTVGAMTAIGLTVIGLPGALALSLLTGLLSFVPTIGPLVAGVPLFMVALVGDPPRLFGVALVYLAVHLLEGNVINPLVQQRTVSLPPVLLITAQILLGLLLGFLGLLVATPLTIALIVMVQKFYVEDYLGDSVKVLGTHSESRE